MKPNEFLRILHIASSDIEKFERLKDVLDLLIEDSYLFQHSRDTFLPAARDYLRSRGGANYHFQATRIRRAKLGGASRWLYYHQRQTFEKALGLLCPFPLPDGFVNWAWHQIQQTESRMLSRARK